MALIIGNKPVCAFLGDKVHCPEHGETEIIEGFFTTMIEPNKTLAYDGCKTSCGAVLIAGGQDVCVVDTSVTDHLVLVEQKEVPIAKKEKWKDPEKLPENIKQALKEAMQQENIAEEHYSSLSWIIAQESGGRVDCRNSASSARGLFQLTRANYLFNPHGESSFGNAVEECQGGIRYILKRYHSPESAVAFWKEHIWY